MAVIESLDLSHLVDLTVHAECEFAGEPDETGRLLNLPLILPEFSRASYFAALQSHDPLGQGELDIWPDGYNRVQGLAVSDWAGLKDGGVCCLLELVDGSYLAVLPLVGPETIAWLGADDGRLMLRCGTLGTAPYRGALPLLAAARAESPHTASFLAWAAATGHPTVGQSARLREEKHYPEMLAYLGWCSWEQYKRGIDEQVLVEAMRQLGEGDVPVRYLLVDDGHLQYDDRRRLTAFGPNPARFPTGWEPLLDERDPDGIAWLGLWLNFNGYWGGVATDNALGELNNHLELLPGGMLQPKPEFLAATAFYDQMVGAARRAGFDFVKVDNQAQNARFYRGTPSGIQGAALNSQALEQACARHTDGLINCMAHNAVCAFNTRLSAVTRCSEDYQLNDAWRAKAHLHNSFQNMVWLGPTVWGDHDMFHSNDQFAGRIMAVSKAVSGGPVYLSDDPAEIVAEHVLPLCYDDGLLLRPLAPAAPLPDSVFVNPFVDPLAYRVIAPLPNAAAVVVAYNLTEPTQPVTATFTLADYLEAPALMQGGDDWWGEPDEGVLLYGWSNNRARVLLRESRPFQVRLNQFEDWLGLICPIWFGWAMVGRPDKYLSPAGVEVLQVSELELVFRLHEPGPVLFWCGRGRPRLAEADLIEEGGGLYAADLSATDYGELVRVTRR